MMARCIALDIDCAQACEFAAAVMGHASENAKAVCAMGGEICRRCADECAKHQMAHGQACADACRRCAQECGRMAATA